jgi:hypothetical protein
VSVNNPLRVVLAEKAQKDFGLDIQEAPFAYIGSIWALSAKSEPVLRLSVLAPAENYSTSGLWMLEFIEDGQPLDQFVTKDFEAAYKIATDYVSEASL